MDWKRPRLLPVPSLCWKRRVRRSRGPAVIGFLIHREVSVQRVFVESTTLGSAGHDAQSTVLELHFRNGAVYQYFRVPRSIYCDLLRADSKGRYFHQNIRGKYPYQLVQNATPASRP